MQSIGAFARSTWLQYVALFQWATPLGYFAYKVVLPVTQIVFFVQLGVFATGPRNALYFALGKNNTDTTDAIDMFLCGNSVHLPRFTLINQIVDAGERCDSNSSRCVFCQLVLGPSMATSSSIRR